MCDYSLQLVASRPARVGDKLISTSFPHTSTRGFASVDGRNGRMCAPRHRACVRERSAMRTALFSLGGSGTRSRSFKRSIRASQTYITTLLRFPTKNRPANESVPKVSVRPYCNYRRFRVSKWTTRKGTIRSSRSLYSQVSSRWPQYCDAR